MKWLNCYVRTMNTASLKSSNKEGTFQLEDSLPPLPVPPLEKTLQKYLESTKPFLTKDEFDNTRRIVTEFGEGIGKELHKKLLERARTHKNWVEQWWEDYAYLHTRSPLAVQCNMGGMPPCHDNIWPPLEGTQCERAAILAWYTLDYFQKMRREQLPVDRNRAGQAFSMNQLRGLFNCTRIPGETRDQLLRYFKLESEGLCSNHVVVFSNGHIFLMRPIDDKDRLLPAQEIYRQLCHIKKLSTTRGQGIGVLTADDRPSFAKAYQHLRALDPVNASHLDTIEQSVFIISLDDGTPKTHSEYMEQSLKGDVYSRWAEKSYGLLCFKTGIVTCNGDHAPIDGMTIVNLNKIIHDQLIQTAGRWPTSEFMGFTNYQAPKELFFTVDEKILKAMEKAYSTYTANAANLVVLSSRCGAFGKQWCKKFKLHPDSVFQLALQLAYYMLHHKPAATYETATTRQFYHGRTETLRSCTSEAVQWCQAMLDPSRSVSERKALFLTAIKKHDENMTMACYGEGCDRHLFGLQIIAMEEGLPVPALYTDPAYTKSGGGGNFILSTSCAGYSGSLGEVAPMCDDGYAVFYTIADNNFLPCMLSFKSSKETDVKRFFVAVNASLVDIQNLVMTGDPKL
ncbi:peroxisomal carnitine O-octanoyltransferase-like isoform X2 [Acanthaster planci]|uniref:Peroxisomal carnitine O-octanoyltransferase n=1 Tax=Acanthaster planci TaxID=133434 RepID=A0A8B7Z9I6_ACAPL|nr:peroxisomal carnitine O-octanoyltransferase-like isoform X2 [Acanthaster planci]